MHCPVQLAPLVVLTQLPAGHAALAGAVSLMAVVQFAGLAADTKEQAQRHEVSVKQRLPLGCYSIAIECEQKQMTSPQCLSYHLDPNKIGGLIIAACMVCLCTQ
jgi:hypothetical protein